MEIEKIIHAEPWKSTGIPVFSAVKGGNYNPTPRPWSIFSHISVIVTFHWNSQVPPNITFCAYIVKCTLLFNRGRTMIWKLVAGLLLSLNESSERQKTKSRYSGMNLHCASKHIWITQQPILQTPLLRSSTRVDGSWAVSDRRFVGGFKASEEVIRCKVSSNELRRCLAGGSILLP